MLLEQNGDFKQFTISAHGKSPITITAVVPFVMQGEGGQGGAGKSQPVNSNAKTGFIIASLGGHFRVFMKSDSESRQPYKCVEGEDLTPHERELNANP